MSLNIIDATNVNIEYIDVNNILPDNYITDSIVRDIIFFVQGNKINDSFLSCDFNIFLYDIDEFLTSGEYTLNQKIMYIYLYLLDHFNILNIHLDGNSKYLSEWVFNINWINYNPTINTNVRPLFSLNTTPVNVDAEQVNYVYFKENSNIFSDSEINDMLSFIQKRDRSYTLNDYFYIIKHPNISQITVDAIESDSGQTGFTLNNGMLISLEILEKQLYIFLKNNQSDYLYKTQTLIPLLDKIKTYFTDVYFKYDIYSYAYMDESDINTLREGNVEYTTINEEVIIKVANKGIESYVIDSIFTDSTISYNTFQTNLPLLDNIVPLYNFHSKQLEIFAKDSTYVNVDMVLVDWLEFYINDNGSPGMFYLLEDTTIGGNIITTFEMHIGGVSPINNAQLKTQYAKIDSTEIVSVSATDYTGDKTNLLDIQKHIWGLIYDIELWKSGFILSETFNSYSEPIGDKIIFYENEFIDSYPSGIKGDATNNAVVSVDNSYKYVIPNLTGNYKQLPINIIKQLFSTTTEVDTTALFDTVFNQQASFMNDVRFENFMNNMYIFIESNSYSYYILEYVFKVLYNNQIDSLNQDLIINNLINDTTNTLGLNLGVVYDHITDITTTIESDVLLGLSVTDQTGTQDIEKSDLIGIDVSRYEIPITDRVIFFMNLLDSTSLFILNQNLSINMFMLKLTKGDLLLNNFNLNIMVPNNNKPVIAFYDLTNILCPLVNEDLIFSEVKYTDGTVNIFYTSQMITRVATINEADFNTLKTKQGIDNLGLIEHSLNIFFSNNIYNTTHLFNPFYTDIIMVY